MPKLQLAHSMLHVFLDTVRRHGDKPAARIKRQGRYEAVTWQQMADAGREVSDGLIALGIAPAANVCVLASSRLEWVIADLGVLGAGAVTVPIYQSNPSDDCVYIVGNCEAVAIVVENEAQLAKIAKRRAELPKLRHIISLDKTSAPDVITFDELRQKGRAHAAAEPAAYAERLATLTADSTLTIIYTSGTTGAPKGAVLSHACMVYEAQVVVDLDIVKADDEQLFFLPLAHVFAKVLECSWWATGHVLAFAESVDTLVANMAEVRPTMMCAVPRVFEKMHARVVANAVGAGGVKAMLARWALAVEEEVVTHALNNTARPLLLNVRWAVARYFVFAKIAARLNTLFGGRMRMFLSGGAPLSPRITWFFAHCGLTLVEGYGMTETSAGATVGRPGNNKIGSVGLALPGTTIKIAEDGEILIKGPGVMKGYYGDPAATAEAIVDGWMHTGDIGVVDADGFLRITDRKKDILITAGGKNVAPQNIENELKAASPLLSQVVVLGDREKYLIALVTLNLEVAQKLAGTGSAAALAEDAKVRTAVQALIDGYNANTASYQSIKKFKILTTDFAQETGELTPTLKVKRKVVAQKFKDAVAQLYQS